MTGNLKALTEGHLAKTVNDCVNDVNVGRSLDLAIALHSSQQMA